MIETIIFAGAVIALSIDALDKGVKQLITYTILIYVTIQKAILWTSGIRTNGMTCRKCYKIITNAVIHIILCYITIRPKQLKSEYTIPTDKTRSLSVNNHAKKSNVTIDEL